jgi:hypothetical protein
MSQTEGEKKIVEQSFIKWFIDYNRTMLNYTVN